MKTGRHYLAIGHRGAQAYEPQNTLRSFRRAIELGADMSELDVHMSSDGHIMVIHNGTIETESGKRAVSDMTLEELKRMDMGKGERIPTLPEVLAAVKGRSGLYIEMKGQGTPRPVADLLRANSFTKREQAIAGSFQAPLVREMRDYAPEIATSILVGPVMTADELIALARAAGADYVHLCWGARDPQPQRLLTPELLDALHGAGLGIVLWNEERESVLEVLRRLPVEGICSDAPDLL